MSRLTQTVNGIVLKEIRTKESDKILTVLTSELGVISIYAKGAMRLNNKFHSATGLFTYSEFTIYDGGKDKLYQLDEADVKNIFFKLTQSVEKIGLAMYMAELVGEVTVPSDRTDDTLRLFLNCLYMMCEEKWSVLLTKAAFEMRLMSDTGFMPDLVGCKRCGIYEHPDFVFDPDNGQLVCPQCKKEWDFSYIICEPPTLLAMRYLVFPELDRMFTFNLTGYSLVRLCMICERFVIYQTKEHYKTLDFLRPLLHDLTDKELEIERKKSELRRLQDAAERAFEDMYLRRE
ncbi:MAG: DNA repair protein RecO [Oscillospiraceae bacterium]